MVMQERDGGGAGPGGSCKDKKQYSGLRATLKVESVGFTDGLNAGVRAIPGPGMGQWVDRAAIY